jgi:cytidylate kinase
MLQNMNKKITIAVDGFAACGKSTLAKALANALHYVYVDSGAMYRAVTLYFIDHSIDIQNEEAVQKALADIQIHFEMVEGQNHTFLNNKDVESAIRSMRVSKFVSPVATISAVRKAMVSQQQAMGTKGGIAMDGRDIGTVVFKNAELKLFLTASIEERSKRRMLEWERKNVGHISLEEVAQNLKSRDHIDSTRADSPLCQAEDAVVIDNSQLSPTEQLAFALDLAKQEIEKKLPGLVPS